MPAKGRTTVTSGKCSQDQAVVAAVGVDKAEALGHDGLPNEEPTWLRRIITDISNKFTSSLDEKLGDLKSSLQQELLSFRNTLDEQSVRIQVIEDDHASLVERIDKMADTESVLLNRIKNLESGLDDLQNRQMRKTLVFRGFPEGHEGADSWDNCYKLISSFIEDHLELADVEIERAHRGAKNPNATAKSTNPRSIFVQFLRWFDANLILSNVNGILKERPYKVNGQIIKIHVEQMVSKNVNEQRINALKIRKFLRSENPEWKIYLAYPAHLMFKNRHMKFYKKYEITDEIQAKTNAFIANLSKS